MKNELIDVRSNGDKEDEPSRFTRLLHWLRLNGQRREHPDFDLNDVIEELERKHDEAKTTTRPFIQPEYERSSADQAPSTDPSDGNNKKYKKPPYEYTELEWYLGWTDGRCGESFKINEEVTKGQVRRELENELSSIDARIGETQTRIPALEDFLVRKKTRLTKSENLYNRLSNRRNENFGEFSKPLGYMYFVFAILLFLADIPLSLKLVASGFQVPVEAEMPAGLAPIGSSTKLLIDHLLFHPLYVIGTFWESIALAAGIAFVGIIVKYYVDVVVLPNGSAKRPHWFVVIILTLILFSFVGTTYFLGNFRAEQQQQAVRRDIEDKLRKENDDNRQFNGAHPNSLRKILREDEVTAEVKKRFEEKEGVTGSKWLTQTFIALTLLLPVVGGVCFSTSGSKLRNAKQLELAVEDYKHRERECDRASLLVQKQKGLLQGLQANRQRTSLALTNPDELDWRVHLKTNLYLHGYSRGEIVPQTLEEGASLYDRCHETVVKLLAQKARDKVNSGNKR